MITSFIINILFYYNFINSKDLIDFEYELTKNEFKIMLKMEN